MGEARRRRLAGTQHQIDYVDLVSGEHKFARNAGDPVKFLDEMMRQVSARAEGEPVPDAKVNCNGCRECCYHAHVDVYPEFDDLKHLDTEKDSDGRTWLKKRADGACVHLGENGCTVYDHRPLACRAYDCRAATLVSMVDTFDGGRHSPVWAFQPTDHHGRVLTKCFQMLGMMLQMRALKTKEPSDVRSTLQFALNHLNETYQAVDALSRMNPEEVCSALGLKSIPTFEEHRALGLKALAGIKTAS